MFAARAYSQYTPNARTAMTGATASVMSRIDQPLGSRIENRRGLVMAGLCSVVSIQQFYHARAPERNSCRHRMVRTVISTRSSVVTGEATVGRTLSHATVSIF